MIIDFAYLLATNVLGIFLFILQGFSNLVPDSLITNFESAWGYVLDNLGYLAPIMPINTLLSAFLVFVTVMTLVYTWRIAIWAINWIPFINNNSKIKRPDQ